jgi:hypothetical protein
MDAYFGGDPLKAVLRLHIRGIKAKTMMVMMLPTYHGGDHHEGSAGLR